MAVMNHVVLHYQPIGQEFKHDAEFFKNKKVIGENQKVSNDYFWKSNKYMSVYVFIGALIHRYVEAKGQC